VERDARLLILRAAAVAFWIACVVFVLVPTHAKTAAPFHGGTPAEPKYRTAVAN
jgi:hypothetical protein